MLGNDTVTIFNKLQTGRREYQWKATVIENVHVEYSRGAILNKYGKDTDNKVELYLPSEHFTRQKSWIQEKQGFSANEGTDLVWIGSWDGPEWINDADYPAGFDQHMLETKDDIYRIHTVSLFKLIPHLEIGCG